MALKTYFGLILIANKMAHPIYFPFHMEMPCLLDTLSNSHLLVHFVSHQVSDIDANSEMCYDFNL
jgi:hypothetical protein